MPPNPNRPDGGARRRFLRGAGSAAIARCLAAPALLGLAAGTSATPGEVGVGQPLRDANLQGLNGPARKLSHYRGRPLLINVWASWCGPCMEEMASLERLAWLEGRAPFAIIGISTDDYPDRALAALRRANATITHYIDHALEMENMLGAAQIPLTVLADAELRVIDKIYGAREWDSAESLQLLARSFRPAGRAAAA